jgi:hypothetical protein
MWGPAVALPAASHPTNCDVLPWLQRLLCICLRASLPLCNLGARCCVRASTYSSCHCPLSLTGAGSDGCHHLR